MAWCDRASASTPKAPRCSSILRTTLLPAAILPINPMTYLPGQRLLINPASGLRGGICAACAGEASILVGGEGGVKNRQAIAGVAPYLTSSAAKLQSAP